MKKPNEQHQFDLLFIPNNVFEGNTYEYILTGIDVPSRYKVARVHRTKKSSEVAFVLESIYKKGCVFKYPKVLQCDNGPEFKSEVTELLEKNNVDIQRTKTKYKHAYTALAEAFNKSWQNCCLNQWMLKSLKTLKKNQQFGLTILIKL